MSIFAVALALGLLIFPFIPILVELVPAWGASLREGRSVWRRKSTNDDFTVLVPIYGDAKYLENVEFLASYSSQVLLCTTGSETPSFYSELRAIADQHGFRIFVAKFSPSESTNGQRQVGGMTRDRVIREALDTVATEFVICVDADTHTSRPIPEIVGALKLGGFDLASVPLVVANRETLLARLQAHEYRMSMRLRRWMPWLCSGACHLAKTDVLRDVMARHSMFFQGNDAEVGLLASRLGYKIGHLPYAVPTSVPAHARSWWRQRFAWSGGEFRLFVVNFKIIAQHPFFILYGALIMFAATPLRILAAVRPGVVVGCVVLSYWIVVLIANRRHIDTALFLYPLYGAFNSLVMIPLGLISYTVMAVKSRNAGVIRSPRVPKPTLTAVADRASSDRALMAS